MTADNNTKVWTTTKQSFEHFQLRRVGKLGWLLALKKVSFNTHSRLEIAISDEREKDRRIDGENHEP